MAQSGYTRQSSAGIVTGATILASGLNAEYNQLVSAFDNASGHRHDTSVTGSGAPLVAASLTSVTNTTAGLLGVDGANGFTARTLTGTAGTITVTNGTGVSGNPTFTIDATYVGQTSITTLGTITTGVWTGTSIAVANGGTGSTTASSARTALGLAIGTDVQAHSTVLDSITSNTGVLPQYGGTGINNNNAYTITLGGAVNIGGSFTTNANPVTLLTSGTTSVTLPTSGTLVNTAVGALNSLANVGTIVSGAWQANIITGTYGGTGVNNGSSTITLGGNLTLSGAYTSTFTFTNTTSVTFPTSGTLCTTTGSSSIATVGTVTAGTWNATKIGTVYGGTNADSSAATGVAQVSSGTWSFSTALASGTTATTQSSSDNSTKVATTAFVKTATNTTPNFYNANPSDPSGINSASVLMNGIAGTFTPSASGTIMVIITGDIALNQNGTAKIGLRYGTGTAPINGAASTGTSVGSQPLFHYSSEVATVDVPFTLAAVITSLTPSTAYWLDVSSQYTVGTPTVTLKNINIIAYELR